MLITTIKAINYLSLHLLLSPLNHLKLFSLMCGLPLLSPITVINIMSYLLITSLNTFGFIPFNRNLKLKTCLSNLKSLWKYTFKRKFIHFIPIVVVNTWLFDLFLLPMGSLTLLLHHTLLNTMGTLKYIIITLSKQVSLSSLMHHFL